MIRSPSQLPDPTQTTLDRYAGTSQLNLKGEGFRGVTPADGADTWLQQYYNFTANGDQPPPVSFGLTSRPTYSSVQKRSFKRACRRAILAGSAGYRGQTWNLSDFPPALITKLTKSPGPTSPTIRQTQVTRAGRRLHVMTWNPGGLSQSRFLELKHWLRNMHADIVIIPETKWGFNNTWEDDRWAYVHSSTSQTKVGGILIMVARKLIRPDLIGYENVIDGRMLHVRLHFATRAVDVIGVYQHTHQSTLETQANRHAFWNCLDDYLTTLPHRNLLVCAGDFNCALPSCPPWTGTDVFRWRGQTIQGKIHPDRTVLLDLMKLHGLVSLTSWSSRTGPSYVHGEVASKIDHILIRLVNCDGAAKSATHLPHADIVPLNSTHHIPVVGHIRACHTAFQVHPQLTACTYSQRAQCRRAAFQDSDQWHDMRHHVLRALGADLISPDHCPIHLLHKHVQPEFHRIFVPRTSVPQVDPVEIAGHHFGTKWAHKRALNQITRTTRERSPWLLFQVWVHWSRFRLHHRTQQKVARKAKLAKFYELCQEVSVAYKQHDAHVMFSAINKYAPKRPLARAKLRTSEGKIADQYQAHSIMTNFVRTMWQGPDSLPFISSRAPGVPFDIHELEQAISRVHPNKSVAQPFLPALVWRSAPKETAQFLMSLLHTWWTTSPPYIPQAWKDSWLFFLPKPGKPNTHPAHLRPISLMEPLGKIVLSILTRRFKLFLMDRLSSFPHFGFLPNRAATDAINRVALHCRSTRLMLESSRRSVAHQIENRPRYVILGGVSLFLDLTRAFDSVDRHILIQHLIDIHTPENLLCLISAWHEHTRYNLIFQGETYPIQVGKGVRQGCPIAPLMWLAYMDKFLQQLAIYTGPQWIQECITLYADDIHIGCQFHSPSDLRLALRNFGHVLNVLESMKLELSYTKSFVLFRADGTNHRHALKGIFQPTEQGRNILIPRGESHMTPLPLKSKGTYLGAQMSYHSFETQTWQHRRIAGWTAFQRLRKWLTARQLPLRARLYLWHTSVHTVVTYGLLAVQLNIKILHEYQSLIFRMLRIVIGDHAYVTHRTHAEAVTLPHPFDLLRRLAMNLQLRLTQRSTHLRDGDILLSLDWSHLSDTVHLIHSVHQLCPQVPIDLDPHALVRTQAVFACPVCHIPTYSLANMRRHLTTCHDQPQLRVFSSSYLTLARQGKPQCSHCNRSKPQCSHCNRSFVSWRSFIIHVERDCCQASTIRPYPVPWLTAAAMTLPLPPSFTIDQLHVASQPFWPILKDIIQSARWTDLGPETDATEHLSHHCSVCGLWCNRFQELHAHYRLHHAQLLTGGIARGAQLSHLLDTQSPCLLCSKHFQRVHSCTVALQVGILSLLAAGDDHAEQVCTCLLCPSQQSSMKHLYLHLSTDHALVLNDWSPARDSLASSDACAHCGQTFDSRSGLRRHITEGRCAEFNPLASEQTCDVDQIWGPVLQQGLVSKTTLTAMQRMRLTTTCQLCGARYDRQGDLVAHLMQSHGMIWTRSQQMLRFLLQVTQALHGCLCNPQANETSVTHVCVAVRQLAMIAQQSTVAIVTPTQYEVATQHQTLIHLQDDPRTTRLIHILFSRDFDALLRDLDVLSLLRHRCVCCGGHYHPSTMLTHQLTTHVQASAWAAQIIFQIGDSMHRLQCNDFQCSCCSLVYNLPPDGDMSTDERLRASTAHFDSNCPIARQVALLLLPFDGNATDGSERPGTHEPNPRSGTSAPRLQKMARRKRRGSGLEETQAPQQRRARQRTGTDPTRGGPDDPDHGRADSGSRETRPTTATTGLLRYVRAVGSSRCSTPAEGAVTDLEVTAGAQGAVIPVDDAANSPTERNDAGTLPPGSAARTEQARRETLGHSRAEEHHQSGRELALPEMVSGVTTVDDCTQSSNAHGQDAEDIGNHRRAPCRQQPCGQVPQPETADQRGTLVSSTLDEGLGTLAPVAGHLLLHGVEPPGHVAETAYSTDVASCATPGHDVGPIPHGTQRAEQRQVVGQDQNMNLTGPTRQLLREGMRRLMLDNTGTMCYANSSLLCYLWASLSRVNFQRSDWGILSTDFCALLVNHHTQPVQLDRCSWFQSIIHNWNEAMEQADSAEFTGRLLMKVGTSIVSNAWTRQVFSGRQNSCARFRRYFHAHHVANGSFSN